MSLPVVTFFNNKGGVGKTSLVYHTAWMLAELGRRVLVVDLDPQANLTAAFLREDQLEGLIDEGESDVHSIFWAVKPLLEVGDIATPTTIPINSHIGLIPGDLALANFEDALAEHWGKCLGDSQEYRAFRGTTAFWTLAQQAAETMRAEFILFDVGPNLGATNRAALIATDHVVVPLAGDMFSIQGLRNLGPTLLKWRKGWKVRRAHYDAPEFPLPIGGMTPTGYVVQQHQVRLNRPVQAYTRWMDKIPGEYRAAGLGGNPADTYRVDDDPECLGMFKHYRSLIPMAHDARKPVFLLRAADGAIGAHANAVRDAYTDFRRFTEKLLGRIAAT
jgi:cellulose biosynthesis protein BcsQ